ncbi:hypothetical protein EYF80_015791 [Liparis tanakae]|uniref:Uncharacterized protein n=1 Tax=Liparis tanakae TaxID=230148 RepID=A0A4Z2I7Z1_9TELE|nr:hypothetical protein EYF80_015791 [Liparis tanakae]
MNRGLVGESLDVLFDTLPHADFSQGMRPVSNLWTHPQSLVQRSSPDSPTFQSGLGPSMVRKDMRNKKI